jgi:steroid delta-isomerase-like uncharacterized protein
MNRTMVVILGACFLLGAAALSHSKARDHVGSNMTLGRKVFTEVYGEGKVNLVDQLYADDFVDDSPGGGKGRELIKEAVTGFHKAAPDLKFEIEDVFATEDKVVIRYTGIGTQTGAYGEIPPSGKAIKVRGITVFLIENGKIKTEWTEYDRLGMLRQIGVVPSPSPQQTSSNS